MIRTRLNLIVLGTTFSSLVSRKGLQEILFGTQTVLNVKGPKRCMQSKTIEKITHNKKDRVFVKP